MVSLGAPRFKVIHFILWHVRRGGLFTGIFLAFARILGEAAALLFTALNNKFWTVDMNSPMSNLPVVIFTYAMSPYEAWQQLAWTGAFLITMVVLLMSLTSRLLLK